MAQLIKCLLCDWEAFKQALLFLLFPTFPYFFLCSYFFSENALLCLLFSPKMFEVTKILNIFVLARFTCSEF